MHSNMGYVLLRTLVCFSLSNQKRYSIVKGLRVFNFDYSFNPWQVIWGCYAHKNVQVELYTAT